MDRDGANLSIWQEGLSNLPDTGMPSTNHFDAIIVGGGITGITTALLLQEAGLKCLVCEAHNLGFGTTSGTTAHLNTLIEANYHDVESDFGKENSKLLFKVTREAIDLVERISRQYNITCDFERKQAILFSQDDKQASTLEDIVAASGRAGLKMDYITEIPISVPFKTAVVMGDQAQMHPTKYILGMAAQIVKMGGTIMQQCKVTSVDEVETGTLKVTTVKGEFTASNVVYASHIPPGVNILHLRNAPYRSYVIAAQLADEAYPEELIYDMYDAYHYFRAQIINGKKYLIVGGEDHKTAEEPDTESRFLNLEGYVRKHFNVASVDYRWSSQYFIPTDGLPYIGHLPGNPDFVYVATGYAGNGITLSQTAAIVLRDLIVEDKSEYKDLFNPARIKPVAGFANFIKEQADVVSKLVSIPFDGTKISGLSELANDEGRIVKYEKQKIALYKDASGRVHAVNPACSHLKCTIAWNGSEKAWECPCHGSRFAVDGEVLTGPARAPLGKVDLQEISK